MTRFQDKCRQKALDRTASLVAYRAVLPATESRLLREKHRRSASSEVTEIHYTPANDRATVPPNHPEAFVEEATFFRTQAPRMAYDQDEAAGYPSGSGTVESANRHAVAVRVKQAGMRWTATAVAGVRALLRFGRWGQWWQAQAPPVSLAA